VKGLLLASMLVASGATLAVAQLAPPARTQDQASDQTSHSSQRMAAYLARVAQNADPVINVYLNRARAAGMRTLLSGPLAPAKEIQLRATIARELINGGLMQEAIEEIDTIRRRMAEEDVTIDESFPRMLRDQQALAYLRVGEQTLGRRPAHGWLFPMAKTTDTASDAATRAAISLYQQNLDLEADQGTRWLLNIAYMALGEYPEAVPTQWRLPPAAFEAEDDIGRFPDVAASAGVAMHGHAGGTVMDDFDGDGLLDLIVSSRGLRDQMRFFHNRGDGAFSDHTDKAGLRGQLGGLNLNHADYDNDGDRDLIVWRGAWMGEAGLHANSLLQNAGDGHFEDVTEAAGLLSFHPTHSGAWGDFDNDGWLDLFVGNESSPAPKPAHPNQLYVSRRDGTFAEVAATHDVDDTSFVKGVTLGDIDNDGQLDIYISNLNGDNVLYHNEGDGARPRFRDVSEAAGVQEPYVSFPTWFWDYDNDGWQDIFVAGFDMATLDDMAAIYLDLPFGADHPRLYRNLGNGMFEERASEVGLDRIILPMGANFGDLDNDGWLDAYFGTGMPDMRALLPNRMVRNDGGKRFLDITTSGGFGTLQKGHGISFGDIDHDGDQDIYHVLGAAFEGDVYENVLLENPGHGNHWLTLQLEGVASHRDAIGARIHVQVEGPDGNLREIHVTVGHGGSFGSSPLRQEIGLGDALRIKSVEILWPGGNRPQRLKALALDRAYHLRQGQAPTLVTRQSFDLSP
jgi:hypothetical protein